MLKKGLVTLVCLIVMSAVWSWAIPTYTVSTEIISLGTKLNTATGKYEPVVGGTVKLRTAAGVEDGTPYSAGPYYTHTAGTKSLTPIETRDVEVQIDTATGFKIASVTKSVYQADGTKVTTPVVLATENLKSKLLIVDGPTVPNRTQGFEVTFAADTLEDVKRRTWQLQATNNNGGGSFTVTRAGAVEPYLTVGKPLVKNYVDTTSVTVAATSKTGYSIDYVVINGVKDQTDRKTFSMTVDGDLRLNTFNFGYKKDSIQVTTHVTPAKDALGVVTAYNDFYLEPVTNLVKPKDNGILPVNPVADPYGVVRMIVAPTAAKNQVTAIDVKYADDNAAYPTDKIILTDRFGDAVTLPHTGAVKVTIKGLTEAVKVATSYGLEPAKAASYTNCTQTCHVDPSLAPAVKTTLATADTEWKASGHRTGGVDCVSCHVTMPGNIVKSSVDQQTFNVTDPKAGALGSNYCSKCHAASVNKVLASAHYTKPSGPMACTDCHAEGHNPAGNRAACASCHGYVNEHTAENTAGKGCVECHDKHNPATITGTLGTPTAHPAVTLYTFEEIGMQMAGGAKVPVQVDANGKGMPYSPKQTCGTSGCHVKGGVDYTYDKISDHAFHSNEGRSEYQDSGTGKFDATKSKPWVQSAAMVGKW